jgi:ceramide glucosyltransferase
MLQKLLEKYAHFDTHIFIETEDPNLKGEKGKTRGPNAKIRNQSRSYREAKGDIIWMVDCNVWVSKGTCGRMVDALCGLAGNPPNKFVHQLPMVVAPSTSGPTTAASLWNQLGGRFEEAWFSAAHAKFYTAINTVLIAPCIVGKSNMFRKSHLDALTKGEGIDYFSYNICEDHLIGDILWRQPVPETVLQLSEKVVSGSSKQKWGNHALDFGDLAIQPIENMSVSQFWSRRVRWLRARKFTVMLATLVEPGTESVLCSLYGAYALTTLSYFKDLGLPQTWTMFWGFWLCSEAIWATVDLLLFRYFETGLSVETDENTPEFAQFRHKKDFKRKEITEWYAAWIGRELLAFPIWLWAIYGGATVHWRGRVYRVGLDMRVRELAASSSKSAKLE